MTLTESQKNRLFWASFLSLAAAGFGFVFRVLVLGDWGTDFGFDGRALGQIFGASLWPIAITMIIFSLVVDKIGYKTSMYIAFTLQLLSVLITFSASSYAGLYWGSLFAGLGHGIVEAVINPVCASTYPENKSTKLNILHAAWPAGLVVGGILIILSGDASWKFKSLFMIIPVIIYGIIFIKSVFPIDERVEAGVSYRDMLRELGGSGVFLASGLMFYEIVRLISGETSGLIWQALIFALIVGGIFGITVKSFGKPLFFILCLIMIPLATTELGTDAWIKQLMSPVLGAKNASWAIVFSAFIMMFLRFFAGVLLKRFSPPTVLLISSIFSMLGLAALSEVSGVLIFIAFVLYAIGQTYYWPTVLGVVSERFPKGGAMTLNTVSAIGLLSVGIIGAPILGVFADSAVSSGVEKEFPAISKQVQTAEKNFFGISYSAVDIDKLKLIAPIEKVTTVINDSSRGALLRAALFPLIMAICFILIIFYFRAKGGYKAVLIKK